MLLRNAGDWFAVLIGQDLIDGLIEQLRGKIRSGSSLAMIFNAAGPLASHSAARSFRKASEIRLRLPLIRPPVLARPGKNGLPMTSLPFKLLFEISPTTS